MTRLMHAVCLGLLAAACDGPSPTRPTSPEPAFYSLSGTVRDTAQAPVVGALVEIANPPAESWRVLTDADGRFQIFNVQAGIRRIVTTKEGYFTSTMQVNLDRDLDVAPTLEQAAMLALGEAITGTVNGDDPVCDPERYDANAPCSRFLLVPPRNGTIEITLTWSDPSSDLDLALMSPFDEYLALVSGAEERARLTAPVNAGVHYEVRVFNPVSSFQLQANLGSEPLDRRSS